MTWPQRGIAFFAGLLRPRLATRRQASRVQAYKMRPPTFPPPRALLESGLTFAALLFAVEILLGHAAALLLMAGWLAVALWETWTLMRDAREVYPRRRRPYRPDIKWVRVGKGALALYHRPKTRDMPILRQQGATHIVTLLSEKENALKYGHLAERHGLTWIWLPMPNANYPEGEVDARLRAALPEISRLLDQGAHIVIHCSAGIHRTGMVAYGLLRWRGHSPKAAMRLIRKMRKATAEGMHPKRQKWGDDLAAARTK